jgi:hypothetical protein
MTTLQEFIDVNLPIIHSKKRDEISLLTYILKKKYVNINGLWLEFGVHKGSTIKIISKYTNKVYGFDSFEGIPESWSGLEKGHFTLNGNLPTVNSKIKLIKGWFDDTLPLFAQEHTENIAFLHIDSDLYSSANTVLTLLQNQIVPGTIIVFDELVNYKGFEDGEMKAFFEFIQKTKKKFEWIGLRGINKVCKCTPKHPTKASCSKLKLENSVLVGRGVAVKILS